MLNASGTKSVLLAGAHFALARRKESSRSSAEPGPLRLVVLSLVAWPILTGVPAYVVALVGSMVLNRGARS